MSQYRCVPVQTKQQKRQFLKLPSLLYDKNDNPQNYKTEQQLLEGKHILSNSFIFNPYIVVDADGKVVARCAVTYYPNDTSAYVGFFEAENNILATQCLVKEISQKAKIDGKTSLIGPVDASIYIGYRFKSNRFDKTYTGEPYNLPYYPELWKKAGFQISDTYVSNQLRAVTKDDVDSRLVKIYNRYVERGYIFTQPSTPQATADYLDDIYDLMMKSYSGFVGFKPIDRETFLTLFSPLCKIVNETMVKLAYDDNFQLRAFCVCLPNYDRLLRGKMTISKYLDILKIRSRPTEYVVLYLGADSGSVGAGGALVHFVRNELLENQCTSIGALIKKGNVSGKMYEDLYVDTFEYVLMKKNI